MENLNNCFYCQELKITSLKKGKCDFCGVANPLYLVNYQNQRKLFCCGCAWWQFPRSETEKKAEEKWYNEWEKSINVN